MLLLPIDNAESLSYILREKGCGFVFCAILFFSLRGGGLVARWSTYVKPTRKISDKDFQNGEKVPAAQKSFLDS